METMLIQCAASFAACIGFGLVFNVRRGGQLLAAAFGGMLGWMVYLATAFTGSELLQYFLATVVISIYSDVMARVFKNPVTGFLLIALLPMVPGGGIYYTMEYCINGNTAQFFETGLHTLGIAGALAIGVLFVSTTVRMGTLLRTARKSKRS